MQYIYTSRIRYVSLTNTLVLQDLSIQSIAVHCNCISSSQAYTPTTSLHMCTDKLLRFTWDAQSVLSRILGCRLLLRWTRQSLATLGNEKKLLSAKQKTQSKTPSLWCHLISTLLWILLSKMIIFQTITSYIMPFDFFYYAFPFIICCINF